MCMYGSNNRPMLGENEIYSETSKVPSSMHPLKDFEPLCSVNICIVYAFFTNHLLVINY